MRELILGFIQMVRDLAKPGQAILASLTAAKCHLLHMAVGLIGEVAELHEAEQKVDRANFVEELGDYEFYLAGVYLGIAREPALCGSTEKIPMMTLSKLVSDLHISTGNLLDKIKRHTIYNKDVSVDDIADLADECYTILQDFYQRNTFDITREEVLEGNMNKLLKGDKARYASGTYSDDQAVARADKAVETPSSMAKSVDSENSVEQFNFSDALHEIKRGNKVARQGWNGKGMFVFLVPSSTFIANKPPLLGIYPSGTEINYHAHIDMKTADGTIVPWLPSQSDLLASDWMVIK